MEIAQVLYDQQFVTYLRKTFLEDNCNGGGNNNAIGSGPTGLGGMSSGGHGRAGDGSSSGFYQGNKSNAGNNNNGERSSQRAGNDSKSGQLAGQKRFKKPIDAKTDFSEVEMPPSKRSRNE